jgi:hypothetical protein
MTFYNIIFGLLFVGAVRELLLEVIQTTWPASAAAWQAATLALLTFGDVVYTSHVVEELRQPYTVWMKLIDLTNFVVLTAALVTLDPSVIGVFQLAQGDLTQHLPTAFAPWWYWALVSLYWMMLLVWVRVGAVHRPAAELAEFLARDWRWPDWLVAGARALVVWGRISGLGVLLGATAVATWRPAWLTVVAPVVFALAALDFVLNAVMFDIYGRLARSRAPAVSPTAR